MFKKYIVLLMLGHILGDFYFQTETMSKRKEEHFSGVFIHGLCYWGSMLLVHIPVLSESLIRAATVIAFLHFVFDSAKYFYVSTMNKKNKGTKQLERNVFWVDQMIHLLCMVLVAYSVVKRNVVLQEWSVLADFFDVINFTKMEFLTWCVALLTIHKPSNIAIQKILMIYKPLDNGETTENDKKAGRYIGTIERVIMILFLSFQQYSAVGLVMTAKSIARYDKISKDKDFAEYYLLGTLLSVLVVMVVFYTIM